MNTGLWIMPDRDWADGGDFDTVGIADGVNQVGWFERPHMDGSICDPLEVFVGPGFAMCEDRLGALLLWYCRPSRLLPKTV